VDNRVVLDDETSRDGVMRVVLNHDSSTVAIQLTSVLTRDELHQLIGALNDAAELMDLADEDTP